MTLKVRMAQQNKVENLQALDAWSDLMAHRAFPNVPPERSDLYADELHEAVVNLVSLLKRYLQAREK
jgi:hypothetical protein